MIKNRNTLTFIALTLLASSVSLLSAETMDTVSSEKTDKTTSLPANISAHVAMMSSKNKSDENQPLWSKDQGRQAELEKKYKEAIAKDPENKKNYAYLAGVYLANNKSGKAIEAYQEAIMHDPENPKLFAAMSIAYLHQSRFAMAKEMADQALKLNPSLKSVNKINQYIVAKQKAIDAASKVPAGGKIPDMSRFSKPTGHGAVLPTATTPKKPGDKNHNPN